MGKSKPKAPPIPDPARTAQAQGAANIQAIRESAKFNQVNQVTPYGSLQYFGELGTPSYTQRTTLNPQDQRQLDRERALAARLTGLAGNRANQIDTASINQRMAGLPQAADRLNLSGMPDIPTGFGALPGVRSTLDVADAPGMVTALNQRGLPQGRGTIGGPGVSLEGKWGNLTAIPGAQDFGAERGRVEDAVLGSMMSRIEPQIQQQRDALEQSLANRGIPPGSEAWTTEMQNMQRSENDMRQQALSQAIQMGGAEQGRLFGQAMQARGQQFGEGTTRGQFYNLAQGQGFGQEAERAQLANALRSQMTQEQLAEAGLVAGARGQNLQEALAGQGYTAGIRGQLAGEQLQEADMASRARGQLVGEESQQVALRNQARDRAIQEMMLKRTQPMNELAALLQGSPALQGPQFTGTPQYQVQPPDVIGAQSMQQNALMNRYNQQLAAQQAQQGNLWGTVGNLGSAAATYAAFSDRRLKTDIIKLGQGFKGLGVYAFRYIWGGPVMVGFMADEVKEVAPWAVTEVAGYMAVDYGRII